MSSWVTFKFINFELQTPHLQENENEKSLSLLNKQINIF